ncbi:MAG: HlyD family efflux transporter periplasmic adaptor subunit [Clostridia bacterium]|nr:HlyD family efflux transporter periplasmic adaptor subunit [Clostridia bacterium]
MTEEKVKKREWVKNAAIIFLAVMLVLTFFSNTIMNHSLPEVAAQYVESGTISATIRGTGTVEANESFSVVSSQTRKVLSVPVKEGDEVAVGDTLLLYADADSEELKTAQTSLDDALYNYKVALLEAGDGTYSKEQRAIEKAQAALDKAKATRDANVVADADIATAQAAATAAQKAYDTQAAVVKSLEAQAASGSDNSAQIAEKNSQLNSAQTMLAAANITYKDDCASFNACALAYMKANVSGSTATEATSVYKKATAQLFEKWIKQDTFPAVSSKPSWWPDTVTFDENTVQNMDDAYTAITKLESEISSLNSDISALVASDSSSTSASLSAANVKLATLEASLSTATKALEALNTKRTNWETATEGIYTAQDGLETTLDALAEAKLADQKQSLDLQKLRTTVSEATKALNALKSGSSDSAIKSTVNGVVKTVSTSAGKTTNSGDELIVVEVPDLGYSVKLSVTKAQSQKVKVGDTGTLSGYGYWGDQVTARLTSIRTDPENPSTNKLLVFDLEGEVDSGSSVTVAIGEKSSNYDAIVPNSAIRSDSNGSFVLAVITKSTPLSNRYIATRIDVEVLASDDVNTAVSGGITSGDFVITTSTKPIEAGTQVRLAD